MSLQTQEKLTKKDAELVSAFRKEFDNLPRDFQNLYKRCTRESFLAEGYLILSTQTKRSNKEIRDLLLGGAIAIGYNSLKSTERALPAELKNPKKMESGKKGGTATMTKRKHLQISSKGGKAGSIESKQDANLESQIVRARNEVLKKVEEIQNNPERVDDDDATGMVKKVEQIFGKEAKEEFMDKLDDIREGKVTIRIAAKQIPKCVKVLEKAAVKGDDIVLIAQNGGYVTESNIKLEKPLKI